MNLQEKVRIAEADKFQMIQLIMDKFHTDDEDTFRKRLKAFWDLSFSHGKVVGTIEGYNMAKSGEPLGQVAHLN